MGRRRRPRSNPGHVRADFAVERRRAAVSALILRGKTYREIADELGISFHTVGNDANALRAQWRETYLSNTHDHTARLIHELNQLKALALQEWDRSRKDKVKVVRKTIEHAKTPAADPESKPRRPAHTEPIDIPPPLFGAPAFTFGKHGTEPVVDDDYNNYPELDDSEDSDDSLSDSDAATAEVTRTVEGRLGDPQYLRIVKDCIDKEAKLLGLEVDKVSITDPTGQKCQTEVIATELARLSERVGRGPRIFNDDVIEAEAVQFLDSLEMPPSDSPSLPAPSDSSIIDQPAAPPPNGSL